MQSWKHGRLLQGVEVNYSPTQYLQKSANVIGKTPAQVALRFLVQSGVIVIPKSTHKERMIEYINVFDFSLTEDEMQKIEGLDRAETLFMDHQDPEAMERFFARFQI